VTSTFFHEDVKQLAYHDGSVRPEALRVVVRKDVAVSVQILE
jgi:hypothetical protein